MPHVERVHLARPIAAVCLIDPLAASAMACGQSASSMHQDPTAPQAQGHGVPAAQELTQLCTAVKNIVDKLNQLYDETIARNRSEIARLAVEIARKVLQFKVEQGDYSIQAVVEEALKQAPARQDIVVRVNPEDLPKCQQIGQDSPDGPLSGLEFVADWSIARADCIIETPKGIVKSFMEQHLERISEALTQTERP